MNREKALLYVGNDSCQNDFDSHDAIRIINKIYDDFENRTCGNCKFWNKGHCGHASVGYTIESIVHEDFGCNRFKKKQDGLK